MDSVGLRDGACELGRRAGIGTSGYGNGGSWVSLADSSKPLARTQVLQSFRRGQNARTPNNLVAVGREATPPGSSYTIV